MLLSRTELLEKLFHHLVQNRGYDYDLLEESVFPETIKAPENSWDALFKQQDGEQNALQYLYDIYAPLKQAGLSAGNHVSDLDLDRVGPIAERLINIRTGKYY